MPKPRKDVIGMRFGKLTVLKEVAKVKQARHVKVSCDCGNSKEVSVSNLLKGTTTSCGCVHKSIVTSHGHSQTHLYKVWANMLARCNNPEHAAYENYGGRGITVTTEWLIVDAFIAWANTCGNLQGLTLDRKDNAKGYSPDNCQWVSRTSQQRNRRSHTGSSSKYIGVCFHKLTNKWKAHIKVNKVLIHLGYHFTEVAAAIARDKYILDNKLQSFTLNNVIT